MTSVADRTCQLPLVTSFKYTCHQSMPPQHCLRVSASCLGVFPRIQRCLRAALTRTLARTLIASQRGTRKIGSQHTSNEYSPIPKRCLLASAWSEEFQRSLNPAIFSHKCSGPWWPTALCAGLERHQFRTRLSPPAAGGENCSGMTNCREVVSASSMPLPQRTAHTQRRPLVIEIQKPVDAGWAGRTVPGAGVVPVAVDSGCN